MIRSGSFAFRLFGAAAIALAGSLLLADPAEARRGDESRDKIDALIDEYGIDRSRIKSVSIQSSGGGGEAPSRSYSGWITFNDCKGNLVIELSSTISVRSVYATGDCTVPEKAK